MIRLNQQKSDTMKNKIYENVLMLSHCGWGGGRINIMIGRALNILIGQVLLALAPWHGIIDCRSRPGRQRYRLQQNW